MNGSNDQPCTTVRLDILRQHEKLTQHHTAVRLEAAQDKRDTAIDAYESQEFTAIKGAFKLFHFFIKRNIPYTTNFAPLLDICIELEATDLKYLQKGGNASYTSMGTVKEFLECLSEMVEEDTVAKFKYTVAAGLMMDEGTDIAVRKELVHCAKVINNGFPETLYLKTTQVPDGTSESIVSATMDYLDEKNIPVTQITSLTTDGAAVMTGKKKGVATKLKAMNPA